MQARLGDRSLFPSLSSRVYLNHASVSPPSLPAQQAVRRLLARYAELGLGAVPEALEERGQLRGALARLAHAEAREIGFVPNTTTGVQQIALNLVWEPGDAVVILDGEFPANTTPWQQAARLFDLELRVVDLEAVRGGDLQVLFDAMRGARLVALSAVQFSTGFAMPLAEIGEVARKEGVLVFVDAIQALGAVPMPWEHADFLAAGGHKWLMGLEGAGMLMVRQRHAELLEPRTAGWLSHEDPLSFLLRGPGHLHLERPIQPAPAFVEGGVQNALGYAALHASVALLLEIGVERIFAHVQGILDGLEAGLVERGFESVRDTDGASTILSLRVPAGRDPVAVQQGLSDRGIACALPDGYLRFSPHWPNDAGEVEVVLGVVDEVLG